MYPHSEDEAPTKKRKIKAGVEVSGSGKVTQFRQSRHKNVFKNFGGTLVRFIIYNEHFQKRLVEELDSNE